jgi:2-polyprenyl-3-methyl-5-hydroxy-6-metoxy-1,4-benzoquinol methylase
MIRAFDLLRRTLAGEVPPRMLLYAVMNKAHCWLKTGNRSYEFNRIFLQDANPWRYQSSPYERRKYERTMERVLRRRAASGSALEVGCSNGVFTAMLADRFKAVTALDVSDHSLGAARERNGSATNLSFLQGDIRSVDLGRRFDVIVCAETLYYIGQGFAPKVTAQVDRHLSPPGIVVFVSRAEVEAPSYFYFDGWEEAFSPAFSQLTREVHEDERPWRLVVFGRNPRASAPEPLGERPPPFGPARWSASLP